MDKEFTKKIVSLYITIADLEYLREKEVKPSHLLTSAIHQLRAQEMFIDPEYEWDNNYLFTQVVKHRQKIAKLAKIVTELNKQISNLEDMSPHSKIPKIDVVPEKTI